ncbi:MAG: thiopurine S-methyltransferase [Pseudomonas sp.]|uniref:thiopurine S-methyltransferase n=1 Tax=Pseudomonas sp. TaxID=306 RepID=UPI0033957995
MDEAFWQARWSRDQIGFHLPEVNPYLRRHWQGLALAPAGRVLVPLCGKTLDLAWLAAQGHRVVGVELAQKAVEAFFQEQGLLPEVAEEGAFVRYRVGTLELWCGDFFALQAHQLADCVALYDRAALIALPAAMRLAYAEHLARILPAGVRGLLITLDYDQARLEGPPFAVSDAEARERFAALGALQLLQAGDVLGDNWKFLERGLDRLEERVYGLNWPCSADAG